MSGNVGSYQVSYTATDQFGATSSTTRSVIVIETPEISLSTSEIEENTQIVGQFSAAGADSDSLSFTVAGGIDASLFSIDDTSRLRFSSPPDFESPRDSNQDNIYEVEVLAIDGRGLDKTIGYTITVASVNDVAPSNPSLSNSVIDENTTFIGTLSATDSEGDVVSFRITDGNE